MSLEEFLEQLVEDEENKKVLAEFYPSSNTVMFQRFKVLAEGLSLLEEIVKKYLDFMIGCKVGTLLIKFGLQLFVGVLLDMYHTRLESSNLNKVLEWKNTLKDLLFMKFRIQFILDKIQTAIELCIARDNENKLGELAVQIACWFNHGLYLVQNIRNGK